MARHSLSNHRICAMQNYVMGGGMTSYLYDAEGRICAFSSPCRAPQSTWGTSTTGWSGCQ